MTDIATELLSFTTRDHERGCAGREYVCSCGYDNELEAAVKRAVEEIGRLTAAVAEARAEGMEEAARIVEELPHFRVNSEKDAEESGFLCRATSRADIASAIRKAKESKT